LGGVLGFSAPTDAGQARDGRPAFFFFYPRHIALILYRGIGTGWLYPAQFALGHASQPDKTFKGAKRGILDF